MRALAEFVMRGRVQAAITAAVCWFLPLLSPAIVALVTLRRGWVDGSYIVMWAFLPILVFTIIDPALLPFAFSSLAVLVVPFGGALVLRALQSWALSSFGMIALCATAALVGGATFTTILSHFVADLNERFREVMQSGVAESEALAPFTTAYVLGLFAVFLMLNAVFALILARWWQALLYNPGGFRAEFYQLRLSKTQSLVLMGVAALLITQPVYASWGLLVVVPLLMVSVAVVHHLVFTKKMGSQWLVGFYLLVLFDPALLVAMLVGFFDPWVNYRARFGGPRPIDKDE